MVELKHDALVFSFPEVHRDAVLRVEFQRSFRVPDDGRSYALPSAPGRFPLRHVDDFARHASPAWIARGGIMLPMHRSDALRLSFASVWDYPFAIQAAVGRIDALTGGIRRDGLHRAPQDYLVVPQQRVLPGSCAGGTVRQLIAMTPAPNHDAKSAPAAHGGIQLAVHPMKREARAHLGRPAEAASPVCYNAAGELEAGSEPYAAFEIYADPYDLADWDLRHRAHCVVYLTSADAWRAITGAEPPTAPWSAADYARAGVPWEARFGSPGEPGEADY